jgi:hypothetical protein
MSFKSKAVEWLKRYGIAEIISTVLSLFTAWVIMATSGERVISALAGSIVASISFYGVIAYNDVRNSIREHRLADERYRFRSGLIDFRNLIIEFGPAELLDVFIARPFLMYIIPVLTGEFVLSTLAGKVLADIIFYLLAIVMYEIRKKHVG